MLKTTIVLKFLATPFPSSSVPPQLVVEANEGLLRNTKAVDKVPTWLIKRSRDIKDSDIEAHEKGEHQLRE